MKITTYKWIGGFVFGTVFGSFVGWMALAIIIAHNA